MATLSAILSGVNRLRNGTPTPTIVSSNLATPTVVTSSGAAWTFGAYTVLQSSNVLTSHSLSQIVFHRSAGDVFWEAEVATGAAGSEAVVYRTKFETVSGAGMFMPMPVYPLVAIPANDPVSMRVATSDGSTTNNLRVELVFIPRPI